MPAPEPSRAHWTEVDSSSDPGWFIRILDATRRPALRAATADPARFFGYLELTPGLTVLDVGSGTGDFDRLIAGLVGRTGHVVGIDHARTMVEEAQVRSKGLDLPVDFRQADAHALPFPDATFDRCVTTQVFQHLPDPARGIAEMVRVARSGGRVVITEPDWDSRVYALGDLWLSRAVARAWADKIPNPGIARELPQLFAEAGLTRVRLEATPYLLGANTPEIALELVSQPLRDLLASGAIDQDRVDRTVALVKARIEAGTWLDAALMMRATGEKR